jgi:5-methylthioribose kinase
LPLFELSAANAAEYLSKHQGIDTASVRELGGGVSNAVLLITTSDNRRIVMKQSLGKLRVEQDWFSDRERIHRECDAIRRLHPVLPTGSLPQIVFEDRDNCIFAMTAAPEDAQPWKSILMNGVCDLEVAARVGEILGRMITASRQDPAFRETFSDLTVFDQLRLDAYYRSTATRHPDLQQFFTDLINTTRERDYSLVHGDWSPKNLLVSPDGNVVVIDFEVVHFADPAFDAGFLINHLLLKTIHLGSGYDYRPAAMRFFETLTQSIPEPWFETATIRHLGALMLARVDGKSPAEYIQSESVRSRVRKLARGIILDPPQSIAATMERL